MSKKEKIIETKDTAPEKFQFWSFLKTKRWARVLLIVTVVLVFLCGGGALALNRMMNTSLLVDSQKDDSDISDDGILDDDIATSPEEQDKYMNVLLCGVDHDKNSKKRAGTLTDVMMVIHLDFVEQTVDIIQLPRDTYIGKEYNTGKLNAVYGQKKEGGIENLARKINAMLKIPIDHYVMMDMNGFEAIVDSIGGVTVDSPYSFTLEGVTIKKGVQTLNGKQANKFVRERHAYAAGDLTRMKMQQIFMKAFASKCLKLSKSEMVKLAPNVYQYLTTDMTINKALSLYSVLSGLTLDNINFHSCEVTAFRDPHDGLSKLSVHAKPLADVLNEHFRENGEELRWDELGILEYDTHYAYSGPQDNMDTHSQIISAPEQSSSMSTSQGSSSSKPSSNPSQTSSSGSKPSSSSSSSKPAYNPQTSSNPESQSLPTDSSFTSSNLEESDMSNAGEESGEAGESGEAETSAPEQPQESQTPPESGAESSSAVESSAVESSSSAPVIPDESKVEPQSSEPDSTPSE